MSESPRPSSEFYIRGPEKLEQFYLDILGWPGLVRGEEPDTWIVQDQDGAQRNVLKKLPQSAPDEPNYMFQFTVSNLRETLQRVRIYGGRLLDNDKSDEEAILEARGFAFWVFCVDPEGNTFGLRQLDNQRRERSSP